MGVNLVVSALLSSARSTARMVERLAANTVLYPAPLLAAWVARLALEGVVYPVSRLLLDLVCTVVDCRGLFDLEHRGLMVEEVVELAARLAPYNALALKAARRLWRLAAVEGIPVGRGEWPEAACARVGADELVEWAGMHPLVVQAVEDDAGLSIWYRPGCLEYVTRVWMGLRFSTRSSPATGLKAA